MPPIQGGVKLLLIASCYGNKAKFRPDEPLGFTSFSRYANDRQKTHLISLRRIFIEIPQKNINLAGSAASVATLERQRIYRALINTGVPKPYFVRSQLLGKNYQITEGFLQY